MSWGYLECELKPAGRRALPQNARGHAGWGRRAGRGVDTNSTVKARAQRARLQKLGAEPVPQPVSQRRVAAAG
eukprot:scaffold1198_cov116-Isochrysis_galbana.AAC.12